MPNDHFVRFENVDKSYDGKQLVVKGLDLDIAEGEFVTMLGPSGSGKTTCLMMLAGFETPTNGQIYLDNKVISDIPPHKRGIGMVFQNYALFPHMSVFENIAFPLKLRNIPTNEKNERVKKALETVQLGELADRRTHQLSGGQKQRVALARAFVFSPRILLMDEPLSALDKKLREQMQIELKQLHRKLGVTTVYVTHDQREALTMSDRIAVINHGEIIQIGTPKEIYNTPKSSFVADFIGESTIIPLELDHSANLCVGDQIVKKTNLEQKLKSWSLVVRPERLVLTDRDDNKNDSIFFRGKLSELIFQGETVLAIILLEKGGKLSSRFNMTSINTTDNLTIGQSLTLKMKRSDIIVVRQDSKP